MDALHAAALAPTLVATCCAFGGRSERRVGMVAPVAGGVTMLAAMVDVGFGIGMLPPLLWAVFLTLLALATGASARISPPAVRAQHEIMLVHGVLGLMLMAGMIVAMGAGSIAMAGPDAAGVGHSHGPSALGPLLGGAGIAYALYSVGVAAVLRRRGRPTSLPTVEVLSMGAAALLMGLALA